ncbi:MAG TPA: glycosyltransferase [Myxococcales bacterium]|nr:glycosyltransferase [Myxococcales bacterium]
MRVLIGAFGTRGDVQPMLALSQAMMAREHAVTLAVPPTALALAREVVPSAVAVGMGYEEVSRRAVTGKFRDLLSTVPLVRAEVNVQLEAMEGLAAGADVIAGSSVFTVGSLLGERFDKPYAFFLYCPQVLPSGDHPNPTVRRYGWPRWLNRLSWKTNDWLWGWMVGQAMDAARTSRGLPPMRGLWKTVLGSHPVAACDPALASVPGDYPGPVRQVGALFMEERSELSAEVSAFLQAGPPPVYFGFGSMWDPDPGATTGRLIEAARMAGVRALIHRGWAGLGADAAPEEVLFIGPEPHGKLFPRCAAVVHHGGAGTTHAAARAGVPQVLMPHLMDQFYWRRRVALAGIGPPSVPRFGASPEPLARAVRACLEDEGLRERARALSARMVRDGAARAVKVLEGLVAGEGPIPARPAAP